MKQLVCVCGWKSELYPDDTMFAGPGGELNCPECTEAKRNRGIEVYGSVTVKTGILPVKGWSLCADINPPFSGKPAGVKRLRKAHYYHNYISLCGRHSYIGGDYLPEFLLKPDPQMAFTTIPKCKECEKRFERETS